MTANGWLTTNLFSRCSENHESETEAPAGQAPSEGSRGERFLPLPGSRGCRSSLVSGRVTPITVCLSNLPIFTCQCSTLQGHQSLDSGPTLNPGQSHLKVLSLIISAKTLQIRPHSQVPGVRTWTCPSGGMQVNSL